MGACGAALRGNTAKNGGGSGGGGGVYVYKGETFTMSGGAIQRNKAEFVGGGVYLESGATFTQGAGVVSGNTAGDGEGEDVFRQ